MSEGSNHIDEVDGLPCKILTDGHLKDKEPNPVVTDDGIIKTTSLCEKVVDGSQNQNSESVVDSSKDKSESGETGIEGEIETRNFVNKELPKQSGTQQIENKETDILKPENVEQTELIHSSSLVDNGQTTVESEALESFGKVAQKGDSEARLEDKISLSKTVDSEKPDPTDDKIVEMNCSDAEIVKDSADLASQSEQEVNCSLKEESKSSKEESIPAMDLRIVNVESQMENSEEVKSDDENELVIDLVGSKKSKDELSSVSSNLPDLNSCEKDSIADSVKKGNEKTTEDQNGNKKLDKEKGNSKVSNETDEPLSPFEKLEKSLRELRESLDENKSGGEDDKIAQGESSVERNKVKSNENPKSGEDKDLDKELEEEMESLLNEYRESANTGITVLDVDSQAKMSSSNIHVDKIVTNQEMEPVISLSITEGNTGAKVPANDQKDLSVKELETAVKVKESILSSRGEPERTGKEIATSTAKDTGKEIATSTAKDTADGSDTYKQYQKKQKLYDSNEMWSKLGMHRCTLCSFTTDEESLFQQHMCTKKSKKDIVLKHKDSLYHCESCMYTTGSRKKYEEHLAFHLLSHPFICLECKTTFETKNDIEVHVKTKHTHETVRCGLRASKKINDIIDILHRCGYYRFPGRTIDTKALMTMMQSKEQGQMSENRTEIKGIASASLLLAAQSASASSDYNSNSDSADSVVIYLSEPSTPKISGSITTNVPVSKPSVSSIVTSHPVTVVPTKPNPGGIATNVPVSKPSASSIITSHPVTVVPSKQNPPPLKTAITPSYQGTVTTSGQAKPPVTSSSYVSQTPVYLIPVTMSGNGALSIGQHQYQSISIGPRMMPSSNSTNTSTRVQPVPSTAIPPRSAIPVMSQQHVGASTIPMSPNYPGGQFISFNQLQQPIINPSVIGNAAPGTRLILVPEAASNSSPLPNQIHSNSVVSPHIVTLSGTKPLNSTALPLLAQPPVGLASVPILSTLVASAPPPSYEETVKNKQSHSAFNSPKNWTSLLNKQSNSNQNTTTSIGSKSVQTPVPTGNSKTTAKIATTRSDQKTATLTTNSLILPKPPTDAAGILATSMVMSGDSKGDNKLFFRKSSGKYSCECCSFLTIDEESFREHIWKHFHDKQSVCKHCTNKVYESLSKCALVERVLIGLHCAAAAASVTQPKPQTSATNDSDSILVLSDDEEEIVSAKEHEKVGDANVVPNDQKQTNDTVDTSDKSNAMDESGHKSDSANEKEDGPELQLKITSIVSLHSSKQSDVSFSVNDNEEAEKEMSTSTVNIPDSMSDSHSQKENDESDDENRHDKLSENAQLDRRKDDQTCTSVNSLEKDHSLEKGNDLSEQSKNLNDNEPAKSSDRATPSLNLDESKDQEISGSKHDMPKYNYGGSFYVCGFSGCSFKCMTSPEFRDHLTNFHSGASIFTCAHCGHKSYTEECYLRHMFVHSNAKSFVLFLCKCGSCKYGTNLINSFKEHLNTTHPSDPYYKCSSCLESFQGTDELISHLQSNLLKFVQCPYCTVKDRNRKVILSHISQVHPGKAKQITVTSQLICQERESNAYVAPQDKQMDEPVLDDESVQQSTSNISIHPVELTSVKQESLETLHETVSKVVDSAFQKEPSKEKQSSARRRSSEDSGKSVSKSNGSSNSLVKCPYCTYISSGKGMLKKHTNVHDRCPSKQMPFMCPYCPTESNQYSKFVSHVGLHCGNQKPHGIFKIQVFYCSHCSFQSNLLGKVFQHGEKTHVTFRKEMDYTTSTIKVKSRSFMCEPCGFYTRDKAQYDQHIEMHKNDTAASPPQPSAPVIPSVVESPQNTDMPVEVAGGDESRRFCCKECNKMFKRLPHLKQHLSVHIKDEPYQLTYFRCSYCGFSSTSKLWISRHTEEKHPGKLIRIKRRVESVSSLSSARPETPSNNDDSSRLSIDTYHCDCCAFSCSDRDDLIRHTKLHFVTSSDSNQSGATKVEKPPKKAYDGPTEPFIIPAGNVYKLPVSCSKCNFSTKLRLELLRHVKMHPMLIPESEQSPRKEGRPTDKATKLLVKTTFLKRRLSSSPDFKARPAKKKKKISVLESSSESDEQEDDMDFDLDDNDEDDYDSKKEKEFDKEEKAKNQTSQKPGLPNCSLYFLGGDLLHNKLKPCYSEEAGKAEFTCLYCGSLQAEKYPLHKHLLQHMDVSFYKCAYCEFGALEVTPILIHIQREHRKPIKHIQQNVKEVESKINKAIHDMKAQHYLGVENKPEIKQEVEMESNIKLEPQEEQVMSDVSVKSSPDKLFKSPSVSSFSSQGSSPKKFKSPERYAKKPRMLLKCKVCGYTSSSRATINRHGVVHLTFKRYACPYCVYRSHWKPDALKHVAHVHSGEEVRAIERETPNEYTVDFAISADDYIAVKKDDEQKSEKSVGQARNDSSGTGELDVKKEPVDFTTSYKCTICLAKFKSMSGTHRHFRTTKCGEVTMHGCSSCRYKNLSEDAVIEHIKVKHETSKVARVLTLGRSAKFRIHKIPVRKVDTGAVTTNNTSVQNAAESSLDERGISAQLKIERTRERNGLIKKVGNLYKCKVCSYRGQRSNVSRHLATHAQLIKHACPFCDYRSNWNFNIKRHVIKYHSDKKVRLKDFDGPEEGPSVSNGNSQESVKPEEEEQNQQNTSVVYRTKFRCLVCKCMKQSISGIYRHLRNAGCNQPMYGCTLCNMRSMKKVMVTNHIAEKHPNKSAEATVLSVSAKFKKIKYKVLTGSDGKETVVEPLEFSTNRRAVEVKCPSCQYVSPTRVLYQQHFDKFHKGMFLACSQCPYKTQLYIYLYKHNIKVHQTRDVQFEIHRKKMRNKDVRFQCPKCEHQSKKTNMRAHLYFHLDYRPINCGHCKYRTRKQMIAKKHILSNHPGLPLKIIVKQDKQVEAEIEEMMSSMAVAEQDLQQLKSSDSESKEPKRLQCEFENCDFTCIKSKRMRMHIIAAHTGRDDISEDEEENYVGTTPSSPVKKIDDGMEDFTNIDPDIFSPMKNYTTTYSNRFNNLKEMYKCKHCPFTSQVKKSMVSHYYGHIPHIFKCPYCDYRNYPRSRTIHHITTNHAGKKIYIIDLRSNQPASGDYYKGTMMESRSPSPKKSRSKQKTSTPPKKAKKEKKKLLSLDSYDDLFTSEGSSDENDVQSLDSANTGASVDPRKITYQCNFCNYKSSIYYHYRQHLATHGGFKWLSSGTVIESRLKCGMCSFLAVNDEEFKSHMEKHLNTRPFICPYCDFSAFTSANVKKHVSYKHPDKPLEAHKNNNSGDLVVTEGAAKQCIQLVEMEPRVNLYDIFSMESENFERLLTDAEVSVIDLQYIPDEKFDIVSKTLGFSSEEIKDLEEPDSERMESVDESEMHDQVDTSDETLTEQEIKQENILDSSLFSTESMDYETLDEVSDSLLDEDKVSASVKEDSNDAKGETNDALAPNMEESNDVTEDYLYEDVSDTENDGDENLNVDN